MQLPEILEKFATTKIAPIWDRRFGSHREVVELLAATIFEDNFYSLDIYLAPGNVGRLDSSLCRYFILKDLVEQGHLTLENLQGFVLDIGSHQGQSVDGIAMYGGKVYGADVGYFASWSASGIGLFADEGISAVRRKTHQGKTPSLVTCFNADWVENMSHNGWCLDLYDTCMDSMDPGGELLLSFGGDPRYKSNLLLRGMVQVDLPRNLSNRENYVLVARK